MTSLIYVCAGGFLGAAARYILGKYVGGIWKGSFPMGTFMANISGSFLLGLLYFHPAMAFLDKDMALGIGAGFLGSFTTFSTFEYETLNLLEKGKLVVAAVYVVLSFFLGFTAAWAAGRF